MENISNTIIPSIEEMRYFLPTFGLGCKQIVVLRVVLLKKTEEIDKLKAFFSDKKHGKASIDNLKTLGLLKGGLFLSPTNYLLDLLHIDAKAYKRTDTEVSK